MSKITVVVPTTMRQFIGGQSRINLQATSVQAALDALVTGSEQLHNYIFDASNKVNRFVRIFVDGRPATLTRLDEEKLTDGAVVTVVLALAGG